VNVIFVYESPNEKYLAAPVAMKVAKREISVVALLALAEKMEFHQGISLMIALENQHKFLIFRT
jgi:hypothetical protein